MKIEKRRLTWMGFGGILVAEERVFFIPEEGFNYWKVRKRQAFSLECAYSQLIIP